MKYFSMFSGIGGMEEGIRRAYERICDNEYASKCKESEQEECSQRRFRSIDKQRIQLCDRNRTTPLCIGYSEIDKYAIQTYEKNFKGHKNYGDATKINTKELPDFDLLVGGFPCQSFSIAGKRKGFNDTRGTLFFDIARILKDKKPQCFLLENVKGLLSHEGGNTFTTIIRVLSDIGYFVEWQVLNSKNFGVPQNRERVFIIGHFGRECRRKIFPIGQDDKEIDGQRTAKRMEQTAQCLKAREYANWNGNFVSSELKETKGNSQGGIPVPFIQEIPTIRRSGDRGKQKVYLKYNEVQTLSSNPMSDNIPTIIKEMRIRRLTPVECSRLQGFPDNWTKYGMDKDGNEVEISDTQRYKQLGNAVTVNVIEAIMKRLL